MPGEAALLEAAAAAVALIIPGAILGKTGWDGLAAELIPETKAVPKTEAALGNEAATLGTAALAELEPVREVGAGNCNAAGEADTGCPKQPGRLLPPKGNGGCAALEANANGGALNADELGRTLNADELMLALLPAT